MSQLLIKMFVLLSMSLMTLSAEEHTDKEACIASLDKCIEKCNDEDDKCVMNCEEKFDCYYTGDELNIKGEE